MKLHPRVLPLDRCYTQIVWRHGALAEPFLHRGAPAHIRSDNGPEFCAEAVESWLNRLAVNTLFIEPGSPWENGYVESQGGKLKNELLNAERFTTLKEAQVLIALWRDHYNRHRPHSLLGYRPPAPEAWLLPPRSITPKPFMT